MKFLILSREAAEVVVPSLVVPNAVISITDPDSKEPVQFSTRDFTKDVLYLQFFDLDGSKDSIYRCLPQKYIDGMCTDAQAKQIVDFAEKVKDQVEILVVHCEAGISRSAGVAAAVSLIYGQTDKWVFMSKMYCPNMFVYRKILNEYNKIHYGD